MRLDFVSWGVTSCLYLKTSPVWGVQTGEVPPPRLFGLFFLLGSASPTPLFVQIVAKATASHKQTLLPSVPASVVSCGAYAKTARSAPFDRYVSPL